MPFEFCAKHSKRFELGVSVCRDCALAYAANKVTEALVRQESNAVVRPSESNGFDKRAYQREYMRERRAKLKGKS